MSRLMAGRVLVVGSYNTDLILEAGRLPRPGETVLGARLHKGFGGKGANQAVAAARMGASVAFVGNIGRDANGDAAVKAMRKEGIDVSGVARDKRRPSGVGVVILGRGGQNAIVVAPGSNSALTPADVDKVKLHSSDVLAVQLEVPIESVVRAIENGSRAGATVVLNPAPAAKVPARAMKLVDWIIPNETEAAFLTGLEVDNIGRVREAARALQRMGARNVIITLGRRGVWLRSDNFERRLPGHKVKAVDTTAAGDAFVGGFAARLAMRDEPLDSVRLAQAAAALSVTRLGAMPSLPTRAMVAKMLKAGKSRSSRKKTKR